MSYPYNSRKRKKKYRLKPFPILIAAVVLTILIAFIVFLATGGLEEPSTTGSKPTSSNTSSQEMEVATKTTPTEAEVSAMLSLLATGDKTATINVANAQSNPIWNLILVNRVNKLSGDMDIEKTQFDTQWVDRRAASAYEKMVGAAKKDGISLYLRSGYRSVATQTTNYNAEKQRNLKAGNSEEEAIRLTEQYYARPGESEHHTGLAFDIITPEYHKDIYTLDERFAQTEAFAWLKKHSAEYGFVLRYPKDKVDTTKINYEPWHYRYVGIDHAKVMNENSWCLEEYIANLRAAFALTLEDSTKTTFLVDGQPTKELETQYIAFAKEYPTVKK